MGSIGLAAINISMPVFALLMGLALMFSVGNSVMVGKLLGERQHNKACELFSKAIFIITLFSMVCSLLIYLSQDIIFSFLEVKGELKAIASTYLSTILLFMPFLMIGLTLDYLVRVDENPNLAFIALFAGAVINVLLDYIFIVNLSLGIQGAALATGLSYILILFILAFHFFSKKATLKFTNPIGDYSQLFKGVKNGFSEFVNESSVGITTAIFNFVMIKNFGVQGVAAYTIVSYTLWLSLMVSFAISDSLQPIISKNYGAKLKNRIKEFLKIGGVSILVIEVFIIFFILNYPNFLINLFLQEHEIESKKIAHDFITLIWPAFLFNGFNLLITAYLTSIHKPLPSASIALLRSLILPAFFIFTLPTFLGFNGVFLAIAAAEFTTLIVATILFYKNSPKLI